VVQGHELVEPAVDVADASSGHGSHGTGRLAVTAEEDDARDCLFGPLFPLISTVIFSF
jgi:hypothetical protein